tara:strand:- start:439 stop:726 length:288 start_codon:yes stop_codon:yes gene_type:complete
MGSNPLGGSDDDDNGVNNAGSVYRGIRGAAFIRQEEVMVGKEALVHSIGPNGVYAQVVAARQGMVKIKYYDADDGGDIERWVRVSEVTIQGGSNG